MQMVLAPSFPGRILYYWSNSYSSQLKGGEDYAILRPVISVCFVDGVLFPESEEYHLRFKLLEETAHFPFTDDIEFHLFQLGNFTKTADQLESDLDLWLYVLNNGKGLDLEKLPASLRVPEIQEALGVWAMLTQDRIQREIYEAREKARRDAADWQIALKRAEERVRNSFTQGREEGRSLGEWIGQIRLSEQLLHRPPRPDVELTAMTPDALRSLAESLRAELLAKS
jgi:predicted transposase/invertase (TIGR01784 family)